MKDVVMFLLKHPPFWAFMSFTVFWLGLTLGGCG